MAAFPTSGQDGIRAASSVATPARVIYFAHAAGGTVGTLHSKIETGLAPSEVVDFPARHRRPLARFEEAVSMGVGYIALAGFVSGLAVLLMA